MHASVRRARKGGPCRGLAFLAAVPAFAVTLALSPGTALAQEPAGAPDTLRQPPLMRNRSKVRGVVEVDLTAAPARLPLLPGHGPVPAYAYNGTIPGPTLELSEGDSVIIHFHNRLPEPTTVHWHGVHLPANADGSPLRPVAAGASYDYVFRVPRGSAGTYWYHPHPDRTTTRQVALGLFGAIVVRAADDPLARAGIPEKLLILSDNRFGSDGSVSFPDPSSIQADIDLENGREGNVLFVNGQLAPVVPMRSGEVQHWRIINASAARVYRLAIPGQSLLYVASDGGFIEHPVELPDVLLANSERAEVLVRGTGAPGSRSTLEDRPYDRYMPQTRPTDWDSTRTLLTLAYADAPPVAPVAIPTFLRAVAPVDTSHVAARRVIVFSQGLIDGRTMDMHRVDIRARLGTTEIWTIQNVVGMDHPFHLHGFQFQVLDREGKPEPFRNWKDSVNVPRHSSVRIAVHFTDYGGRWMYHCHILDHEDEGMMGILELH